MNIRAVSINDGMKELEYLRGIKPVENGFYSPALAEDLENLENFKKWLQQKENEANGINIKEGYVPQTVYWIELDNEIIGVGKLRHYLNERLLVSGGHIGMGISTNNRSKGLGTEALGLLIEEAYTRYGIDRILFTNDEDNMASRRIVEKNGAVLEKIVDGSCYYWVDVEKKNVI